MKKILLILSLLISCSGAATAAGPEAKEILDHVDDLFRGQSSYATMTMQVVTRHYSRQMSMEAWSRGKDYSLFRITAPAKEKGTATLKAANNIWNYLPKVNRVIKIPSSMMGGSWMGSHFTNDDLVKESRMAEDYHVTFKEQGKDIIELSLTPKSGAAVVWGKVVVTVRQADWMPLKIDYYDEDLDQTRSMVFSDIRDFANRRLPARLKMTPTDKPDEYTEIIYHELNFDVDLAEDFFSLRTLKK